MALVDSGTSTMDHDAPPARLARATHAVFISLLVFVILPSRYLTGLQTPASPTSSSTMSQIGIFVVWVLLWRLCASRPFPTAR